MFVVWGLWFGVCGLWFVVWGLWFVVCGLWFVVWGLWFVVCCSLFVVYGFAVVIAHERSFVVLCAAFDRQHSCCRQAPSIITIPPLTAAAVKHHHLSGVRLG